MKFLDIARVHLKSGAGGNGCVSFRREAHIEFGGPDGGNGGKGGNVYAHAIDNLNTLIDFRFQQHFFAENGKSGAGQQKYGRNGADKILFVPVGTEILEEDKETLITDLHTTGQKVLLVAGGNGGFGNLHFKTATNQAPRRANGGQPALERTIWLRLKLIADIGLVGLPNAGKSTFLAATTRAKPKIADYPFTTLHPNLGVLGVDGQECVIADIPGLIEGAHRGVGLGARFLGHVERCSQLLHIIDATGDDIVADYKTLRHELECYGGDLASRGSVVVLNKIDALTDKAAAKQRAVLERELGVTVFPISAVSGQGVTDLLRHLMPLVKSARVGLHDRVNTDKTGGETGMQEAPPWTP